MKKLALLWEKIRAEHLQVVLTILFVMLFVAFVLVMFCVSFEGWLGTRLGLSGKKNEILTFLGIGMGGALLAIQALMSYKRAKAMEDAANAQADAAKAQAQANQNTEQGQRQERLKNAIEHLGHASDSVRLGGAYELFHLAQDTKDLRQTILDILCAHIRRTTGESEYREKHKSQPSEEVQSLLTLLFVQDHKVFKGLHINLQGSWLNGADLRFARLKKANLTSAYLQGAFLFSAKMQEAELSAKMQRAFLLGTKMQGALLFGAKMQGAFLKEAKMQGAFLLTTEMQGAILDGAEMQEASLLRTEMQGATSSFDRLISSPYEDRIRESIGNETDLSGVIFGGGLSREDVDSLVEGLSDEKVKKLREKLEVHIDQPPSHQPPKGAITGTYTKEEAEQWIAEYNKAMSEVPPESDN